MSKKNQKVPGATSVDTPKMEEMRQLVVEQELSARSWKAYYEKMYFSLEAEKLEGPYAEYQERTKNRIAEERAKMIEALEKANPQVQESTTEGAPTEAEGEE